MKSEMPITLTTAQARRFMIRATGLDGGFGNVASALRHLGFVQIDPINVCGRMQDHILRHRVRGYREQDLMRHVHREGLREAFEHHLPDSSNLAALPLDAWPHLQRAMRVRERSDSTWSGKLTAAERKLAARMLTRMAEEGPLCSQDIESARKAKNHAWDSTTLAKSTLQKLFFHGRVLIARRDGLRRYYDLPEKVLPAAVLNAPVPTSEETARWLALLKLRQRRLAMLKAAELRVIADEVVPVTVEGSTLRLHLLRSDLPLLDDASEAEENPKLIAPLDPIIYDRRVTEELWDFHYRWEVYVPPQKRVRGYYALPLLHRAQFIGHADVKADREAQKLQLLSQEPARSLAAKAAIASLASFLSLNHPSPPKTP
ncbi:MAG: YcaQ family DNA glycosylase [Verrucomicrobiaceae bacterium]|nr:YcaQ family DNA glycosylase [Verrucomicrobiaceae bacterium]